MSVMRLSLSPERIIVVNGSSLVIAVAAAVGTDTHAIASLFALAFFLRLLLPLLEANMTDIVVSR